MVGDFEVMHPRKNERYPRKSERILQKQNLISDGAIFIQIPRFTAASMVLASRKKESLYRSMSKESIGELEAGRGCGVSFPNKKEMDYIENSLARFACQERRT